MKFREVQFGVLTLTIAFVLMVWGFWALLFSVMPSVFRDPIEDMSFGWYVPVFSVYVLWTERRQFVESFGRPSVVGALLTLPFLFLGFLGVRGIQIRFQILSFIGLLVTVPWAVCGRETAKRMLFPAGFLLFCIPLATFLDVVTVHLRLLATGTAFAILKGIGAAVVRTGTMLAAADGSFSIDVAEPCSGLRSIFALMALTAGYAYFNQPSWLRRALLFACSVPLAVLGNVMRILTICLVGSYASADFATGFYHDYSGFVVFAVAIALMVVCGELITRLFARFPARASSASPAAQEQGLAGRAVPVVTLTVLAAGMFLIRQTPTPVVCEPPVVALGELKGFKSEAVAISESEATVLPADTRIEKRVYSEENGHWFAVTAVIGGTSKSSIHRPELCLPSQGFMMTRPHDVEVGGVEWRVIRLDGSGGRPSQGFAYTFFNQDGYRTSSHVARIIRDVWDRSFHNRIDRWVMVTVNSSRSDDSGLTSFLARLKETVR